MNRLLNMGCSTDRDLALNLTKMGYEMFKLEQKRFYAERRGRIIKFKHDDSEVFEIIGKGLENLESQSNGLLMV